MQRHENISPKRDANPFSQENNPEPIKKRIGYVDEIAERLSLSLKHLNINESAITISLICDFLNYESVSEVEKHFFGEKEPPLKFLQDYSNFFGIELKWLRHGKGNIFTRLNQFETYPLGYLKQIIDLKPKEIYFVRSGGKNGDSGVILMMSEYSYMILPRTYKISGKVGATGMIQIEGFYELIRSLCLDFGTRNLHGLVVSEEMFFDLFYGKIYPGKILHSITRGNYWWDDFLDYEHKMPISESYVHLYGSEFVEAQQIIKWRKEKDAQHYLLIKRLC